MKQKTLNALKKKYHIEHEHDCICCGNPQYYDKDDDIPIFGFCNCDEEYGTSRCKHYKLKNPNKFKKY